MDILSELPLGFSMALAKNPEALQAFSNLSDYEKRSVIDGTHTVQTKREMQEYVNNLPNYKSF
ncbi:MAG: YdeI/OmpD-associated family protein [Acutalibacteraceae bacterium]